MINEHVEGTSLTKPLTFNSHEYAYGRDENVCQEDTLPYVTNC